MFFDDGAQLLSEQECQTLLASASVGRMSLTLRALPVVLPVNYQYLGGDVIIGMSDGPIRRAVAPGNVVALGVDSAELSDAFWAVLVIGRGTEISDLAERTELQTLGLAAPTGVTRAHYLRLRPDIITGYRAPSSDV